jgi:hypothetical protein
MSLVIGIPVLASPVFLRRLVYERDAAPDADAVATSRG